MHSCTLCQYYFVLNNPACCRHISGLLAIPDSAKQPDPAVSRHVLIVPPLIIAFLVDTAARDLGAELHGMAGGGRQRGGGAVQPQYLAGGLPGPVQ